MLFSRLFIPRILVFLFALSFAGAPDIAFGAEGSPGVQKLEKSQNTLLTAEEQAWLRAHPEIRVANETDWPPYDFTDGPKPQGFSIDLMRLAADKTGLNINFVNGFSWAELVTKFKNGDIDVMPAIIRTAERSEWMDFTRPYADNPTALVVNGKNKTVQGLADLSGKTVAVIPGYSTVEELQEYHPEINQVAVADLTEALVAVSSGRIDAFVGSLGPVSYVLQHNYITNIRVVGEVLREIKGNKKLHMAVAKDNTVLFSILQKGLDAISVDEKATIYQRWIKSEFSSGGEKKEDLLGAENLEYFFYLPPVLLLLLLAAYLYMFKRLRLNMLLAFTFIIFTSLAITVIAMISFQTGRQALEEESFNRLTAVREIKAHQIEDYFALIKNQIISFSESQMIIEAMERFAVGYDYLQRDVHYTPETREARDLLLDQYYQKEFLKRLNPNLDEDAPVNRFLPESVEARTLQHLYISENSYRTGHKLNLEHAGDGSYYSNMHRQFHSDIRSYLFKFGYYDIFLVEPDSGHIVYSVYKEVDYGTSLLEGPYKDTNIAKVFRQANAATKADATFFVDFEPYPPSYNEPAAFIASPIFDHDEKIGVLIFQMPVEKINEIMTSFLAWAEVGLGESGETYLIGPDFTLRNQSRFFIEDRANYLRMIEDVGFPVELIANISNFNTTIGLQPVKTIGAQDAMAGNANTQIFPDYRGVEVLSSYKPLKLEGLGWVILSEIDKDEAFSYVYFLRNVIVVSYVVMLLVIVLVVYYLSNHITAPLKKLTAYANDLAQHDFSQERSSSMTGAIKTITTSANEVGILAKTLLHMKQELEQSVQTLMHTTVAKERMESELNIGKEIQMQMLPSSFPEQEEIDVFGTLLASREVGGDWFDCFFVDDDHFCFGIGDVSGKGVPAALFMAVAQTLIKASAPLEKSTADVINLLNKELSEDNPNFMFATIFLCILNIRTGELLFTNAAHNPSYILNPNGDIKTVDSRHGLVVGPLADSTFDQEVITLSSGDTFFMYTDGVTEAMDPDGNFYTDPRLFEFLKGVTGQSPEDIVQATMKSVKDFEAGGEQADDITILAVTFHGSQ